MQPSLVLAALALATLGLAQQSVSARKSLQHSYIIVTVPLGMGTMRWHRLEYVGTCPDVIWWSD